MKYLDIIYDSPNKYSDIYLKTLQESCPSNIEIRVHDKLTVPQDSNGILVMYPTKYSKQELEIIPRELDLDNIFGRANGYVPATAQGIFNFITSQFSNLSTVVAIVGRGKTVGRPLIDLCINYGYTVVEMNSETLRYGLLEYADVIVGAASKANCLKYISVPENALLIDTGRNFGSDKKTLKCGKWTRDIIFSRVV